ncbi:ATP-binding protein [Alcaligenaceae bacterium C4P045]|nr:ATP-binding protein [Alcaligenaceae bacterium C4P045]
MRPGITFKLFLAVLAVGMVVTLAMGAALRWRFEHDFLVYVNEREGRRVERMVSTLTRFYIRDNSWEGLRRDPNAWVHMLTVPPPRDDFGMLDDRDGFEPFRSGRSGVDEDGDSDGGADQDKTRPEDATPQPSGAERAGGDPDDTEGAEDDRMHSGDSVDARASDRTPRPSSDGFIRYGFHRHGPDEGLTAGTWHTHGPQQGEPVRATPESFWRDLLPRDSFGLGDSTVRERFRPPPPPPWDGAELDFPLLPMDPGRPPPILPRFTLVDPVGTWVAGAFPPAKDAPRHPITVDGRRVGWLIAPLPDRLPDEADRRFQIQQVQATWIIGGLAVILAMVVSVLLARIFLAPVRRLAAGTQALVAGDYKTRVRVTSSDELGRLARDFNRLAHSLERNEALRREWLADISHELRTPLAVMRGEIEALQDGIRPLNAGALISLQSEVAILSALIDDLYELALADVGALTYHLAPMDLGELVTAITEGFGERLASHGVTLTWTPPASPVWIEADQKRLTQLFANLLENTVRYTHSPGELHIALVVDQAEGRAVLTFDDTPPAVPDESLLRIFDRLFRVEGSRNRASGGAGLGLAICQRIVEGHQGTITAHASPLGGLQVKVCLPLPSHPIFPDTTESTS